MVTRLERVVLELEDQFTGDMLKAAAATKVLDKALDDLSGSSVRMERSTDRASASTQRAGSNAQKAARDVDNLGHSAGRTGSQIDTLSGRVSLLASGIAVLGPGLIPLGAVGIPALTGLASGLGFAAAGTGVLIAGFQGVGDALTAVNKAALEPTKENLAAADQAMAQLGPDAQAFVGRLRETIPFLKQLRDLSAQGMFPGFTDGLDGLEQAEPRITRIVGAISQAIGDIGGEAGQSLGSERWAPFLDFVAQEGPQALRDLAKVAGSTGHALAELWMAFDPLNDDVSQVLVRGAADFDKWASGLSKTEGFEEFVRYVEKEGPQLAATIGAISNAFLQIVEAGAPLGGPVLEALEHVADVVAGIADSKMGPAILAGVAAWRLYAIAASTAARVQERALGTSLLTRARSTSAGIRTLSADIGTIGTTWMTAGARTERETARVAAAGSRIRGTLGNIGRGAAPVALLGAVSTGAADKIGLANTATLALAGSLAGPWGAAAGAAVGLTLDLAHAHGDLEDSVKAANKSLDSEDVQKMTADYRKLDEAITKTRQNPITAGGRASGNTTQLQSVRRAESVRDDLGEQIKEQRAADEGTRSLTQATIAQGAAMVAASRGYTLTAAGARSAGQSGKEFTDALDEMHGRLSARGAEVQAEAAIDDFRAALKQARADAKKAGQDLIVNGRININIPAGQALRTQLDNIAESGLRAAEGLKAIGNDVGAERRLDKTRAAFIRAAVASGIARSDARGLANDLIGLDQLNVKPKVGLSGVPGAIAGAHAVKGALDAIHDRNVQVAVHAVGLGAAAGAIRGVGLTADGSTVPKTGLSYADRHLYLLADGEEVISNRRGQADRHRPLLKAINADRLADGGTTGIRGLADGGTADLGGAAFNGVTIKFPSPSVLSAAVRAANEIAALNAKTSRSAKEQRDAGLEILHTQQQIRDLNLALGKTGKDKLTGLDRTVAIRERQAALADLADLRNMTASIVDLRNERIEAAKQLTDLGDVFARGPSAAGAVSSLERDIHDMASVSQTLAQLRAKGASPLLLQQIANRVNQGDFRNANRLGQSFLAQPALLSTLNSELSTYRSQAQQLALMTTAPQFLGGGRWDPRGQVSHTVDEKRIVVGLDTASVTTEVVRQVMHRIAAEMNG